MAERTITSVEETEINALNKKIVEIKRKIQLSEGQRKANFEETDARKQENLEKIDCLKKEIKDLYVEYARAKNNDEAAERATSMSREPSARIRKRKLEDTIMKVTDENVRLRKKYDLIVYQREKAQKKLSTLIQEHSELKTGKMRRKFKKKLENPLRKKIISLEIQLEHMRMMYIKASGVRKKYKSISLNLKTKAVTYASMLEGLEDSIKQQEAEINRLKGVKKEAIELKDNTQDTLIKQQIEETSLSKQRDSVIQEYRQRVAGRKMELDRLEKMIFPSRPREDFDTLGKKTRGQEASEDIIKDEVTRLEDSFAKLCAATGVSKSEDVLNRFLGQRATKQSLQNMRMATEQEKMLLEKKRQQLVAEMEIEKFSETKNAEQTAEQVDKLNGQIAEQQARQRKAEEEFQRIEDLLNEITKTLKQLYSMLNNTNNMDLLLHSQEENDPIQLISLLTEKLNSTMEVVDDSDKYMETLDGMLTEAIETMSAATTPAEGKPAHTNDGALFPQFPSSPLLAGPPSEDEEEVPTRNALKRQAQLLVDTKSRRKGFVFKR